MRKIIALNIKDTLSEVMDKYKQIDYQQKTLKYSLCEKISSPNYVEKGAKQRADGKTDKAIISFEKALKKKPDNIFIMENLADIHSYTQTPEKAIPYLLRLIKKETTEAPFYYEKLGTVLYEKGDYNEAEVCFLESQKSRRSSLIEYNLGITKRMLGKTEEAKKCLETAVEYQMSYHPAWYQLSIVLYQLGEYAGAKEAITKAIDWTDGLDPLKKSYQKFAAELAKI